jgi:hypothetical protein
VDGRLFTTLRGDSIVAEFLQILDRYIEARYSSTVAGHAAAGASAIS